MKWFMRYLRRVLDRTYDQRAYEIIEAMYESTHTGEMK